MWTAVVYNQLNYVSRENNFSEIQDILDSVSVSIFQKQSLMVTLDEREDIEVATREQRQSQLWYLVRTRRITDSTCGKILCQHDRTTALLKSVLYSKPFEHLPASIKWGVDNESKANEAYIKYTKAHGKVKVTTSKCGFIIHPTIGWFGASPDARVRDPHSDFPDDIVEFKCPYPKRKMTPCEACQDPNFYCISDNGLHLRRSHHYYHQVQFQLFVGIDLYDWCDFCVYMSKGTEVERIWLNTKWCEKSIDKLDSYYHAYTIPEILSPLHKPSYVL